MVNVNLSFSLSSLLSRLRFMVVGAWLTAGVTSIAFGDGATAQATFNDNTVGALAGQQGGTDFYSTNSWVASVGSGITVASGDLAAPTYVATGYTLTQTGTGEHLYSSGGTAVASRAIANGGLTNSTMWFSFLARVDSGGRAGIEIDDPQNSAYNRILVRTGGATGTGLQVYIDPGTSVDLPGTVSLVGSNVLVVGRLTLNTSGGNDTVDVWVNPNVASASVYSAAPGTGQAASTTMNWDTASSGATAPGVQYLGVVAYSGGYVDNVIFSDLPTGYAQVTGYQPAAVATAWGGFVNGSWDSTTTNWGYGSNFTYLASSATSVTFADTNSFGSPIANSNITVQAAGVSIGTVNLINSSVNYLFQDASGNTGITGATFVNKAGTGVVTFASANTYTGGTTLSGGTLAVSSIADSGSSAIGPSGSFTLGNGILQYTGSGPAATTRTFTGVGGATPGIDLPAGSLTLSQFTGAASFTLLKTGGGTLTLAGTGDNAYLQATVNGGIVVLAKTSAGGVHALGGSAEMINSNGMIQLAGAGGDQISDGATVTVNSGGAFDLGGQSETISGLTLNGAGLGGSGALTNSSATAGALTLNATTSTLGSSSTVAGVGDITITGQLKGNGSAVLTKAGGNRLVLAGTNDNSSLIATVNNGTLVLAKTSNSGVHALGGNTDTVNNGGILQLAGTGGDQIYFQNNIVVNAGGIFDLNGQSEGFDGLTGGGWVTNGAAATISTLTLGQNNSTANPVFAGTLGDGSGTQALVKTGAGIQTLSGSSSYSGGTIISNGTLWVAGQTAPNSGTGVGAVTIAGGTLSGNGRVAGSVTVANTAGAMIYPNNSATLTLGGSLTFAGSSATAKFNLGSSAAGASDRIVLENQTITGNGATIVINSTGTLDAADYVLVDAGAAGTVAGSFNPAPVFVGTAPTYAAGYSVITTATQVRLHYTPLAVGVTAVANTKIYDGTTTATAVPAITAGSLAAGDSGVFTESYGDRDAGGTKTLIPAGGVKDAGNNDVTARYDLVFNRAPVGTISPTNLTVSAVANSKAYDGTTAATATPTITAGSLQAGDAAHFTESYDTANVGTGKTLTPAGTVIDGNGGNNYSYTFIPAADGSVTQSTPVLTLGASANPAGFRDGLTFTAVAPADATGTVQFQTNGAEFDTEALSSGSAVSVSVATLPRGTNSIMVIYSGDGNYLAATNTLAQVVTNHPPLAGAFTVFRTAGLSYKIALSDLATNWSDADGDSVALVGINPVTTNGVSLVFINVSTNADGSWLVTNRAFAGYAGPNLNDQVVYTITDGQGGTNTGLVNIAVNPFATGQATGAMTVHSGVATIGFCGIPGYSYITERATNLAPAVWVDIATNVTPSNGVFTLDDNFADLGTNTPVAAYYRLRWQP